MQSENARATTADEEVTRVSDGMPGDQAVTDVADVFSLLGDPGRVRILSALLISRLRVRDLATVTGLSESAVQRIVTASRELVTA